MASTYSPYLQIQLIASGDQSGTWGNTTNTNLGTIIEQAIAGNAQVNVVTANQAFTVINGASDQARCATITLTTTTGAAFNVFAPPTPKVYAIYNNSSYVATIYNSTVQGNTTPAGTGISLPAGSSCAVWTDGTNFFLQNNDISTMSRGILQPAQGGTGTGTSTGSGSLVLATSPTLTGTPQAPTAATSTSNTQIATTAFVQNVVTSATGGLGTMASQNANNVNISGGAITGTYALTAGAVGSNVTFNSSGSGSASGITYNGSTPLTISFNTIGAPSTSGTNASGTWGISVTGTSDHITNAAYNGYGSRTVSSSAPSLSLIHI